MVVINRYMKSCRSGTYLYTAEGPQLHWNITKFPRWIVNIHCYELTSFFHWDVLKPWRVCLGALFDSVIKRFILGRITSDHDDQLSTLSLFLSFFEETLKTTTIDALFIAWLTLISGDIKTKPYQLTYRIREKVLHPLSSMIAYYKFQLNNKRKGHEIVKGNCELLIELASLKI